MSGQKEPKLIQDGKKKRNKSPTELGKIFRILRIEQDMSMGKMAQKLRYSKSYLSQVEIGDTPPSFKFLNEYIKVFNLKAKEAYDLYIKAFESMDNITINMTDLRFLDRKYFSRLLAIIKFFNPQRGKLNNEFLNLNNAIDAIWKLCIPQSTIETDNLSELPTDELETNHKE